MEGESVTPNTSNSSVIIELKPVITVENPSKSPPDSHSTVMQPVINADSSFESTENTEPNPAAQSSPIKPTVTPELPKPKQNVTAP